MLKKIRFLVLLIFFLPILISAQTVDIPKPTRPGRYTVPQTQTISSTLPDLEEEVVRAASIASASSFTLPNQLGSVNSAFSSADNLFSDSFVLPLSLGPTLTESLAYPNMASLTSMLNPPQFLFSSSPAITSLIPSDELTRLAHSGGGQQASFTSIYGPAFFGPNLLSPLGPTFGQGPVPAPFPGSGWYPQGPIPPLINSYGGVFNGQVMMPDPFFPLPSAQTSVFRGPGWYPQQAIIAPIVPSLFRGGALNFFPAPPFMPIL